MNHRNEARGLISVNGKITPPEEATIPALDRGFLFGDNVFEVLVGFHNKILDVEPHLERLRHSAENIGLQVPWSNQELAFELNALAEQLQMPKAYYRLVVTRGMGMGLQVPENTTPNKVIYAFPAPRVPDHTYEHGLALQLLKHPMTERGAAAKTGNYLRSIVALNKAQKEGFQDVLWVNSQNEVTEATTANIFFMGRHGDNVTFYTPSIQAGLLKGITRQTVIQLLNNAKIPCEELIIYRDEIPRFDEAFLCSTVRGLVPVCQIGKHQLHTARDQSVFRHIERLFLSWVRSQTTEDVIWNQ